MSNLGKTKNAKLYDKLSDTQKQITDYGDFIKLTEHQKAVLRSDPEGRDVTKELNAGINLKDSMNAVVKESTQKTTEVRKNNENRVKQLRQPSEGKNPAEIFKKK